jgi:hypothetical protein
VGSFNVSRHVSQLVTDDGLINQSLAESLSLVRVFERFFVANTSETSGLNDDTPSLDASALLVSAAASKINKIAYLVVEVGHNVLKAAVLLADQVLNGHLDVIESNVSSARGPDTGAVHLASGNARHGLLDQHQGDALHTRTTCADSDGEEISEHT